MKPINVNKLTVTSKFGYRDGHGVEQLFIKEKKTRVIIKELI